MLPVGSGFAAKNKRLSIGVVLAGLALQLVYGVWWDTLE